LTLTGTGGVGKTRLALELASRTESKYPDGAVLIDLAPVTDPVVVPDVVAAALGVKVGSEASATESVREHLQPRHVLLVMDNCEQVVSACAQVADGLLRTNSSLQLVVTSREPLRIRGETVWVVPPLAPEESVALFTRRAQAGAAASSLTSAELDIAGEVCRRLEGIPLAIELAAVRVPALGVSQVADLLGHRLDFLSHGNRLDSPRHQTLRAALDWSYELLDSSEQRLFARLGVFAGSWSLDAARAVCGWDELSSLATLDGLVGLVDKSLVYAENAAGPRRYRFLDTIREYAIERLAACGDGEPARARHASYCLAIVEEGAVTRLGIQYPGDPSRVILEHANVRAALGWLLDKGMLADGLALCQAMSGFWLAQGFLREGEEWLARFLARPEDGSSHAFADGLHARGRFSEYAGAMDQARGLFERSLSTSVANQDATVAARALCGLGDVAVHQGDYADAFEQYRQALEAARDADSAPDIGQALLCLGRVTTMLGDLQQSTVWLQQALAIQRRIGDRWGVAYVLNVLGQHSRQAGDLVAAQALLEECHVLWRQAGTRMGERAAVMNLALVNLERGAIARSAELARDSLEISQDMRDDDSATTVRCIEIAAQVFAALGSTPTAVVLVAAAARRRVRLGAPQPAGEKPELDRMLDGAREALGQAAFEAAWARGQDLPVREAVDLAAASLMRSVETRSR
jgi:predicted ATPase